MCALSRSGSRSVKAISIRPTAINRLAESKFIRIIITAHYGNEARTALAEQMSELFTSASDDVTSWAPEPKSWQRHSPPRLARAANSAKRIGRREQGGVARFTKIPWSAALINSSSLKQIVFRTLRTVCFASDRKVETASPRNWKCGQRAAR